MELSRGHIVIASACLIAGCIVGAGLRGCGVTSGGVSPASPITIHDTLVIHDTVRITKHTKAREVVRYDTIWLPLDTCGLIPVELPVTQYEYRDTFTTDSSRIELGVQFSGYKAQIDGIDLRSRYSVQPRTIEKKKGWGQFVGVGVGAGYGVSVAGGHVYAAPTVGVSVVYGWGWHW